MGLQGGNKSSRFKLILYGIFIIFLIQISCTRVLSENVVFIPRETNRVLNNPYMGWAPEATGHPRDNGYYSIPHRLVYADSSWADLEPEKGRFKFEKFERKNQFEYWTSKHNQIIFRLVLDKPRKKARLDIPEWVYDEIKGDGTWYSNDYGKGFSPNYANPVFISYHRQFIRVLAERYADDPRIAFIELGSVGHWGEWHTETNNSRYPFPTAKIADEYIKPYLDYFPGKYLLARRPMIIAKERRIGLYNDMFGDPDETDQFISWIGKGYSFWLTGEKMPSMPDFWKHSPSGGEFAPSDSIQFLNDWQFGKTVEQAKLTHVSWLGPNCPVDRVKLDNDVKKNADRLLNTMGYRYVLQKESHQRSVTAGDTLHVTLNWINKGVAPFYFNWKIELSLAERQGNLVFRSLTPASLQYLLPGESDQKVSLQIPGNIAPGEYTLCLAVIDPQTNMPGVELAVEGKRDDGRYLLGKIEVISKKQ